MISLCPDAHLEMRFAGKVLAERGDAFDVISIDIDPTEGMVARVLGNALCGFAWEHGVGSGHVVMCT